MKIVRLIIIIAALGVSSHAQVTDSFQDQDDLQSWNDVQLIVPINERFDFNTKLTMRFGNNITRLNDDRFAVGFTWKPTKALSVTPFYQYINARNAISRFRIENRLNLTANYIFPIKRFGLSHRSTFERRLRRPVNSWRYRGQLTIEKKIPEKFLPKAKFFVSDEVFYDSILNRFSRNRFSVGINRTINPHLSLDVYYMRQNDGIARPGDLHIIGTNWKIKL